MDRNEINGEYFVNSCISEIATVETSACAEQCVRRGREHSPPLTPNVHSP